MNRLDFEKIKDEKLDRRICWIVVLSFIKDLLIVVLAILGIIKLIGG